MPLPNLKAQCTAKNRRTGQRCKNPAAFGCKACRYHGARPQILKGEDHPNYKHGRRTLEALSKYSQKTAELDQLENIAHRAGVMAGPKRRGSKPTGDGAVPSLPITFHVLAHRFTASYLRRGI